MFDHKYLLIILVFCCQIHQYMFNRSNTAVTYPISSSDKQNCSVLSEEVNKKPVVHMNGQNNYQLSQQIFYIHGVQNLKVLHDKKLGEKFNDNYLVTPGIGAHKLHSRSLNWHKARRACIQEGGHLSIINSNSEEKILLRMMQEKNINQAWLGIHDIYEEGDWVSVLDEPLETTGFTKWTTKYANEPDNYGGQNCGSLITEGGMDDLSCEATISFFCEISL